MQFRETTFYVGLASGIVLGVAILRSLGANEAVQAAASFGMGIGLGYLLEWLASAYRGQPTQIEGSGGEANEPNGS